MIRFRVIKGSHVLLALAVIALAAVVAVILLQGSFFSEMDGLDFVQTSGAKVLSTFAPASSASAFRIEIQPDPTPSPLPASGKRILIYHTHTHEAYTQVEDDPYEALETWRTLDDRHSVVRLGLALAEELRRSGYYVVHDATDHEQQDLSSAYIRSLETLQSYEDNFDLIIDLHRDAYVESLPLCHQSGDADFAQLMLLVGRGDAYTGDEKPDYDANLAFAQRLTSAMNAECEGICRNVTVKKGRYNQHIGDRAILVEVGHNKNTLEQALSSIPVLARAITSTLD